jgi:hypothetical protein
LSYCYIFVRRDLSHPQQVVQASHACIEAARSGLIPKDAQHPHLVVLGIDNEDKLSKIFEKLDLLGIQYKYFIEPDRDNELTSIVTEPICGDLRKHFRKFQLLKGGQHVYACP